MGMRYAKNKTATRKIIDEKYYKPRRDRAKSFDRELKSILGFSSDASSLWENDSKR